METIRIKQSASYWFLATCLFLILQLLAVVGSGQKSDYSFKSILDVFPGYQGWKDPTTGEAKDTVTVKIDSTFNSGQRDSIGMAIDRWNNAGCKPTLKKVTSGTANITLTQGNPGTGNQGLFSGSRTGTEAGWWFTKATITIGSDYGGVSLIFIAMHELGHALGLKDTSPGKNPNDVMRKNVTLTNPGTLSPHDSSEMKQSAANYSIRQQAFFPPEAIQPGQYSMMQFELGQSYSDSLVAMANIQVHPSNDPFMFVGFAAIQQNILTVEVFLEPIHWSGMFFLDVNIFFPPPTPPVIFTGWHYADILPVPPCSYTCPFETSYANNYLMVNWTNLVTYPYPGEPLRSTLTINESTIYENIGTGEYYIALEPGNYQVELEVDDYQGNVAQSSQTITIVDDGTIVRKTDAPWVRIYPNPFRSSCTISSQGETRIEVFTQMGQLIWSSNANKVEWNPDITVPPGIYFIRAKRSGATSIKKVIYLSE